MKSCHYGARITVSVICFMMVSSVGFSHQGHHHPGSESTTPMIRKEESAAVKQIREEYNRNVAPLFKTSCMDCHSAQTRYPWYYNVPGIKQMLDSDITEARHHLDFTDGYPFKSHASPVEDLDAIAESVRKGEMPPVTYRIMHSDAALSDLDKKVILDWVTRSKLLLK